MLDYLGTLEKFSAVFDVDFYAEEFDSIYKRYLLGGKPFTATNEAGVKAWVFVEGDTDLRDSLNEENLYEKIRDAVIAKREKKENT